MKMQRLLSILACCALLMCLLPTAALADGDENALRKLINGMNEGETLKLSENYSANIWSIVYVRKNIIIDLNGHSLTNLQLRVGQDAKVTSFQLINSSATPSVVSIKDPNVSQSCIQVSRTGMSSGEVTDVQIGSGLIGADSSVRLEARYIGVEMLQGGKVTLNGVTVQAQNGVTLGYQGVDSALTLTNTHIISSVANPYDATHGISSIPPLIIRLSGKNTVTSVGVSALNRYGISCSKNLTIIGPGTLDVTSGDTTSDSSHGIVGGGIEINGGATVTATGGTVGVSNGGSFGFNSMADPIVITNATVTAIGGTKGVSYGMRTMGLTLTDCSLIARTLATTGTRGSLQFEPRAFTYTNGYRWRSSTSAAYNNGVSIPYELSTSETYLEVFPGGSTLTFAHNDAYDLPAGQLGDSVKAIDVSGGASGGTPGYVYSLGADAPAWLNITTAGVITGTRSGKPHDDTTAYVYVQDNASPTPFRARMTIRVGATLAVPPKTGDEFPLGWAWLALGAATLAGACWLIARKHGRTSAR
ncbi:MAG: hypothetical protein PHI98_02680 [Eubacteriales bacterium]|nr:hypothetical protein [Eubacteriales bacterium]